MHLALGIEEDGGAVVLVMKREDALHDVRKRGVADVMKQRRGDHDQPLLVVDLELMRHASRDVGDTERVGEARVLRAMIDEVGEAKLADEAQSLHLGAVDQRAEDAPDVGLRFPRDNVVDGVAEGSSLGERGVRREHRDRSWARWRWPAPGWRPRMRCAGRRRAASAYP